MEQQPTEDQSRVLIISAHPDDSEFGAAGSAAVWTAEGKEVFYLVCTRGDKGSDDPNMTSERLSQIREQEQRKRRSRNRRHRGQFPRFQRRGANSLATNFARPSCERSGGCGPTRVVTHDPTHVYSDQGINHPDHRAVGTAVLDSVYPTARDRLNFLQHEVEGLKPHKVREILLWGAPGAQSLG